MLWTSVLWPPLGSLSTHVFETRTTTGRGHFACQDSGVSPIFIPSISNGEKILGNAVKRENSSLPVAVRISKRGLKISDFVSTTLRDWSENKSRHLNCKFERAKMKRKI